MAVRIREAVIPALNNPKLFSFRPVGPGSLWASKSFHVGSITTSAFTSLEIWPVLNDTGLSEIYDAEDKAFNLRRLWDGSHEVVSFRRGAWERRLLAYVGAPLGLLTLFTV